MKPDHENKCTELAFSATETEASKGILKLSECLTAQGLPADKAGDVRIALTEAINNVVEHAYAGISPAKVRVACNLQQDRLTILISDSGNPLPGLRPPEGIPAALGSTIDDLPEGGFGWFLIRELTSEVQYERRDGFNWLSLRFDIPSAEDRPKTATIRP